MSTRAVSSICRTARRATRRPVTRANLPIFGVRLSSSTPERKWSTPLAKSLAEAITTTGPISIANYMRQCLTSPEGGYYTRQAEQGRDQFGKSGDFVTSPEISQIFGELVGVWFVAEWLAQGQRPRGVQLVELGPGRGTLMDDVLRTISNFRPMAEAIDTIYLVEAGPVLRNAQQRLLCGDAPMQEHPIGFQSKSKHLPNAQVIWTEDASFLPQNDKNMPFIIAHEFFDALPIHAFQSVPQKRDGTPSKPASTLTTSVSGPPRTSAPSNPTNEWRELLVSPTAPASPFTPVEKRPKAEFELTTSPRSTPHSDLLPNLSPRYKALLPRAGATVEVSTAARTTASKIAELIGGVNAAPEARGGKSAPARGPLPAGAALVVDYGPTDTVPINSLRGIRSHKLVSPFDAPGEVDLSVDVDFGALVEAALEGSEGVEVHGPTEQGWWLEAMGGRERCEALVQKAKAAGGGGDVASRVEGGWKRLVDRGPNGMGKLYKVMAIVPVSDGSRRPVGFGGDVSA